MTDAKEQDALMMALSRDVAAIVNKYAGKLTLFNTMQTVVATAAALASLQGKEELFHVAYKTIKMGLDLEQARVKAEKEAATTDPKFRPN
jgi:hypothetical protein